MAIFRTARDIGCKPGISGRFYFSRFYYLLSYKGYVVTRAREAQVCSTKLLIRVDRLIRDAWLICGEHYRRLSGNWQTTFFEIVNEFSL